MRTFSWVELRAGGADEAGGGPRPGHGGDRREEANAGPDLEEIEGHGQVVRATALGFY
jgi:hypothetical protein